MSDIIDTVAKAIQAKCVERGFNTCPAPLVYHVAAAAIEAADAFRAEEKRNKCKHWRATGSGGTGDARTRWSCPDCGASYDSEALVGGSLK